MDSPSGSGRACPSCSAPAQSSQRWCLECGTELPQSRRAGLRPIVGIATTLAVLVTAASAGGYTLLRNDRQPPPPAQTVAQAPPTATPPLQPATQEPSTSTYSQAPTNPVPLPHYPSSTGGTPTPANTTVTTPTTPSTQKSGGAGYNANSGGGTKTTTTAQKPQLALTNVALGAAAVVYAPYTASDVDLGDASKVVDGSTKTAWTTPAQTDPTADPQVGIYVDLGSAQKLRTLVIDTPTPGINVEIYAATKGPPASITDSGWTHLATRKQLAKQTKVGLPKTPFRYVLVWVTGLPQGATRAALSELSLFSIQPE